MRNIIKNIDMEVNGKMYQFRIKKLDAFSGAVLLRLISRNFSDNDLLMSVFKSLSDEELKSLMKMCLSRVDVLLDAGYQPIMEMNEWSWSEIEYDAVTAIRLTLKVILWALDGFFPESGSNSVQDRPAI